MNRRTWLADDPHGTATTTIDAVSQGIATRHLDP